MKMKRTLRQRLLPFCAALFCAALVFLTGSALGAEETERSFSLKDISALSILYPEGNITLGRTSGDVLILKEDLRRVKSADVKSAGTTLTITGESRDWGFPGIGHRNKVYIGIPGNFRGKLTLELRSGTLNGAADFSFDEASIRLASGIVELQRLRARIIDVQIVSGTLRARGLYGETSLAVTSGTIVCTELEGAAHRVRVNSGNTRIQGLRGKMDARAVSGNISLDVAELADDISLALTSGGGRITLPAAAAFNLDAETESGTISLKSPQGDYRMRNRATVMRPVGSNPRYTVYVRIASGTIQITQ
jgi:lia operon protein LiaG